MSIIPKQISLGFFLTALSKKGNTLQILLAFRKQRLLEYSLNFAKIAYERHSSEPGNARSVSGCEENHSCTEFISASVFLAVFSSF